MGVLRILILDPWIEIPCFGCLGLDSLVWILGLSGRFRNFDFRSLDLDSLFWIPGFGFLGLDLGFEFLRLDSLVWISGF